MPRSTNPKMREAARLYDSGKTLKEISKQLDVSQSTLRRWRLKWEQADNERNEHNERENDIIWYLGLQKEFDLTEKQLNFCIIYAQNFNATKAYKQVYKTDTNVAAVCGSRMLRNAKVSACVRALNINKLAKKLIKPEDIFQKYMDIAFGDIREYVTFGTKTEPVIGMHGPVKVKDADGNEKILEHEVSYVKLNQSEEVDGTLIQEITSKSDGVIIKYADRMKALQWLADHMNMGTAEQKARVAKLKADAKRIKSELPDETVRSDPFAELTTEELRKLVNDDD